MVPQSLILLNKKQFEALLLKVFLDIFFLALLIFKKTLYQKASLLADVRLSLITWFDTNKNTTMTR